MEDFAKSKAGDQFTAGFTLPGDRFSEVECAALANWHSEISGELIYSNDICRICGQRILMMCYRGEGHCCVNHQKLRTKERSDDLDFPSYEDYVKELELKIKKREATKVDNLDPVRDSLTG